MSQIKVEIGEFYITRGAMDTIPQNYVLSCVERHMMGDWGDLTDGDKEINEEALITGDNILS